MNLASRRCYNLLRRFTTGRSLSFQSKVVSSLKLIDYCDGNNYHRSINRHFISDNTLQRSCRRLYADYPKHKVITLPNLSPTMETGSVVSWGRKEGDTIAEGDLLAEIETDKATMSLDASDDGVMAKILVEAGTKDIPIGTPLCIVVDNESSVAAFKNYVVKAGTVATSKADSKPKSEAPAPPASSSVPDKHIASSSPPITSSSPSGNRLFVSPYAKTLATERGIDLNSLAGQGSGPDGRIRAVDLEKAPSKGASVHAAMGSSMDTSVSDARKVMAQRMSQSKQLIPHYYLTIDVKMDRVLTLRAQINKRNETRKIAAILSVNDFVVKAAAVACIRVPEANSSWQDSFIRQYNHVDVNVIVATGTGFTTPTIFNAHSKGLSEINTDVIALAAKARDNKLQPHEFQGGTFTVTNLGMFGITSFSAIINPPQACILAVGGSQDRLVPCDKSSTGFTKATYMSVTLCCDHRVVDGAVGAKWLSEFRENMEDPANMLL